MRFLNSIAEHWHNAWLSSTHARLRERELICVRPMSLHCSPRYAQTITGTAQLTAIREAILAASRVRFFNHWLFPPARYGLRFEFEDGVQNVILIGDPPQEKLFAANITVDGRRFVVGGPHLKRAFPLNED